MTKCYLCDCVAHMKCLKWIRSNLDFVNEQPNVFWFCTNCVKSVEQLKAQNFTTATDTIVASVTEAINRSLNGVKDELSQTNTLIKSIAENLLSTPTPKRRAKRPRVISPTDTPKLPNLQNKLVGGTRLVENFPKAVETIPKPADKFWIYLSRIASYVTEDEIKALVEECLPDSKPVVRKLVKKDADLKSLAFISFKVGIDEQFCDRALDPAIWPTGIFFRAFEERRVVKDFWGPKTQKIPRTVSPNPTQTPQSRP